MKLVYIAGPYRAEHESEVVKNIRLAEELAIQVWRFGAVAICPHKNTALFGGLCPDETWLKGDLEIIRRCDALLMTPNWRRSEGARIERETAEALGLPIFVAEADHTGPSVPWAFVEWLKGTQDGNASDV